MRFMFGSIRALGAMVSLSVFVSSRSRFGVVRSAADHPKPDVSGRLWKSGRRVGAWPVLLLAFTVARSALGDAISDVLAESEVRLRLKRGQAVGRIQRLEEGQLVMLRRGGVEFRVPAEAVADGPEAFLQEAGRLAEAGMFRRAAIQLGIARLLDPKNPNLGPMQSRILDGLNVEASRVSQFRTERQEAEAQSLRSEAMERFAKVYPELHKFLTSDPAHLPQGQGATGPELQSWAALESHGGQPYGELTLARGGAPADALRRLQALLAALPATSEIQKKVEAEGKRAEAAVQLFLRAAAGLWMDAWKLALSQARHAEAVKNFKPPMETARENAREMLREKMVPQFEIVKQRKGNFIEETRVPIKQDPALAERMAPRIDAPFVEETRRGTGISFVTSAGDSVFVPIEDWSAFDNAAPPKSPEEDFLREPREGLKQFKEAAQALILAWGAHPDDPDLSEALRRLEAEARAVFRAQPGLPPGASSSSAPTSAPVSASAPAASSPVEETQPAPRQQTVEEPIEEEPAEEE